jgi:hypothetical protein
MAITNWSRKTLLLTKALLGVGLHALLTLS